MKKLVLGLVSTSLLFTYACNKNSQCVNTSDKAQIVQSNATDPVLVVINGQSYTESEIEKSLSGREKGALIKARSDMYEAKKDVVDQYVFDKLAAAEADKKKISKEEYLKKEVDGKIKTPSDKDINDFYAKAKVQFEKSGRTPPPLNDDVKAQIKQQLNMQAAGERKVALNQELLKKNKVTFGLEQPRMQVEMGTHPVKGAENAKVTVIEFSDFQCPFCKKGAATMADVFKKYSTKIKYTFRDYPLPFHDRAKFAANAARCASDQGKFWEFHDKLFADQSKLSDDDFIALGKELKLDAAKFDPCVKGMQKVAEIDKDAQDGENAGVSGTPAYFINGIFLSGALPKEKFEEVIDQELSK